MFAVHCGGMYNVSSWCWYYMGASVGVRVEDEMSKYYRSGELRGNDRYGAVLVRLCPGR